MLDINNIIFLIFFTLILGQAITAFRGSSLEGRYHIYWPLSLGFFSAFYLYSALDPLLPKSGYTLANFFLYAGSVAQVLLIRTWNGNNSKKMDFLLWLGPLFACLIYEVLRQRGAAQTRLAWSTSLLALITVWRLHELIRLYRKEPVFTVRMMQFFSVIYLLLCVLRLMTVMGNSWAASYNEGLYGFSTRILGAVMTVLMHIAIAGYYAERFWRAERQALQMQVDSLQTIAQLKSKVTEKDIENEEMSKLIRERDHMLMINSRFSTVSSLAMFNSAIVHELSQPLAALTLNLQEAQWLVQGADPVLQESIDQSVGLVQKIGQMNQSLRNLMMAQKTESESINISTCLREMLPILQNEAQRRRVRLVVPVNELELNVVAHKVLLERIVFNLVANALDALTACDDPHSKPQITLQLERQIRHDRTYASLTVADNGPGFEAHLLSQEWLHFQSTKATGMGVGLILCHYIVSTWNGEMFLQNQPAGGAHVQLWIPLQGG